MKSETFEIRRQRQAISPAAHDEVFAALPPRALDAKPFRELTADLDRQHERLRQLLREIDAATTSE